MKQAAVLIAMLLATPAFADQSEITLRLQKTRPENPVPFPEIRDWKTLKITLVRGACFGTCPSYEVEIDGDGNVSYEGRYSVTVKGERSGRVPVQSVRELYTQFKKADFFSLFDTYRAPITDGPAYRISISFDGHFKEILDYEGVMVGMPPQVRDLEKQIDRVTDTDQWIRGNEDRLQNRP